MAAQCGSLNGSKLNFIIMKRVIFALFTIVMGFGIATASAQTSEEIFGIRLDTLQKPAGKVLGILQELKKTEDFRKAAEATVALHEEGDVNATYALGVWHEVGVGVQRDVPKAMTFYKAAADKGHAASMNNYGFALATAQNDPEKIKEGVALVRKAMDAGNEVAVRNYAVFLLNGIGMDKANPDAAKAVLEGAIKKGDGEAALTLSSLYAQENGIGPDQDKMVENLQKAAELGSVGGQQALGQLYLGGTTGLEKDPAKALDLLGKSSEGGSAVAKNLLATMYDQGVGVEVDKAKALELYLAAADQGNSLAQNHLGNIYQNGTGVAQDLAKALRYFRAAAGQGLTPALYNVGVYYEQGRSVDKDPEKAFQSFLLAGSRGLALAQAKVGAYYLNGLGTLRDAVAARAWFDLAAKQGFVPAQTQLGLLYEQGVGVERNVRTAAQLFSLAADKGDVGASMKLADYYFNGVGVEVDKVRAYVLAGKVAEASEQAAALQARIKEQLTPDQIAAGDKSLAEIKTAGTEAAAE